jgi:hypothetical protein
VKVGDLVRMKYTSWPRHRLGQLRDTQDMALVVRVESGHYRNLVKVICLKTGKTKAIIPEEYEVISENCSG